MVTPLVGFAKDNGHSAAAAHASVGASAHASIVSASGVSHASATTNTSSSSTARCTAFGHFIAPGWLKHNSALAVPANCTLPAGISALLGFGLHGGHGTTTTGTSTDTTAPSLFLVHSSTGTSTATITWFTNERSTSQIAYGSTTAYDATSTTNSALTFFHQVTLSGLTSGTTYHFAARSADAAGNVGTSADMTFTTGAVTDTTAPVLSAVSFSGIGSTTATVNWSTNEAATSKVYYGTSTPLDLSSAAFVSSTSLVTSHSVNLTGLTASTTYHIVVQSADGSNNTATSSNQTFVTLP
jgi:hypothetical protein